MKPSGAGNVKQQLSQILDVMRKHATDPQRVYTCLVQTHDLLDGHPQIQLLVDALLSLETTVKFLQELMQMHLNQEEIQWYWCRVLVLGCNASLRFQCQVGHLALWADVYELRSAHPASSRVLLTSLHAYEALLRNSEHHVLQAKPAQKLIHEMLHTIDRFVQIQNQNGMMVVAAMRVVVTIYASPRLQSLVEDKNALSFAPGEAIVSRLLSTFAVFLGKPCDTSVWLQTCRLQLQQHTSSAVSGLFLLRKEEGIKPWFVFLVEKYATDHAIMYEYAALFTYTFAVPGKLGHPGDLDALAHQLLERHDLLRHFCDVMNKHYRIDTHEPQDHAATNATTASSTCDCTILEVVRVIRQWSSVDVMLQRFAKSFHHMKAVVLRVLIPTLEQTSSTRSSVISMSRNLQLALEILLLFQRLWTVKEYRNLVQASAPLQSARTQQDTSDAQCGLLLLAAALCARRMESPGSSDAAKVLDQGTSLRGSLPKVHSSKKLASKPSVVASSSSATDGSNNAPTPKSKNKQREDIPWKRHTHAESAIDSSRSSTGGGATDRFDDTEPWDISRINKPWEIDKELRRSLPRQVSATEQTAAAPNAESMLLDMGTPLEKKGSQKALVLTAETKAKYFGATAKAECHAIFCKLTVQKYLTTMPLDEFLAEQQGREDHETTLLGPRGVVTPLSLSRTASQTQGNGNGNDKEEGEATPLPLVCLGNSSNSNTASLYEQNLHQIDRMGLFSRQFTARHKFSSLCLEKDLPPCIRLIVRNYFSPEINVSHMAIGDDLACVFAACLYDLPMVTGLNVRNNRLRDQGLRAIIDVVIAKKDMFHIDLSENKVDGDASSSLAVYLGSATCALQSLKLSHADVDDTELAPFAKALHTNKSLQTLDLSNNLIGSTENLNVVRPSIITGGEALATMLCVNCTLTSLDLSWNYLRLGGAVELGKALAFNSGLRELNLAYNAFGNAGAQAIGESLLSNTFLEKLNLSNNNIPAHGALPIASAIRLNQQLVYVNMDGNPLGQTGGRCLLHAVAACTERQLQVSMEGCNFDLTDADAFDPAESTGTYDLNMEIPCERAIALELLRVANTKQGCKFLSIVHTSAVTKQKRNIKVELRKTEGGEAHRRLLKTAGILTNAEASERKIKEYKLDRPSFVSLFYELDQGDSGFIDDSELKRGMRKIGLTFRDEDIPRYIAQYDLDGTGTIELDEFVELMSGFNLEDGHFARECVDLETNEPFTIPTEGRLQIDFVDFHVSVDHDNAHSQAGVERLIENISSSKNKSQMLAMAKSGLFFKTNEAQLLLESVADVYEVTQAVTILLPNMVDPKNAHALIDHNLDANQRVRLQHLLGQALQPMLGLSTGHYKLDLGNDLDRLTLKKIIENSDRTAFLRKKAGLKDTSQHGNRMGKTVSVHTSPSGLAPSSADSDKKASRERSMSTTAAPQQSLGHAAVKDVHGKPGANNKRDAKQQPVSPFPPLRHFTCALFSELESMKTVKNYVNFGDALNSVVELSAPPSASTSSPSPTRTSPVHDSEQSEASTTLANDDDDNAVRGEPTTTKKRDDNTNSAAMVIKRGDKATCTARRLIFNLQWLLAMRWLTAQQAVRLLSVWPVAFESARVDLVCLLFDRVADLHNFNGIMSALHEPEAAQCFYRFGWLNIWTPLIPDNYYELNLSLYEEREVAKALVRLAIDEPGENWQRETFGWELNMSRLRDGGFPEKGFLCLEYCSGADKGCGPVWPTRRELASGTLCGLPDEVDEIISYVDSLSMVPAHHRISR
ncbi:Leucine-rich repeat-containing protein, partial [Globisporangium splendens]